MLFGGGSLLSLAGDPSFKLGIGWQRWPDASEFFVKNHAGQIVPLIRQTNGLGLVDKRAGKAPKWETVYIVTDEWVYKWFLAEFWEGIENEGLGGERGLGMVGRGLGVRRKNVDFVKDWQGGGDRDGVDDGFESECSSRGRGEGSEGVVREGTGRVWVGIEDEDDEETSMEDD